MVKTAAVIFLVLSTFAGAWAQEGAAQVPDTTSTFVTRGVFTSAVVEREPVDAIDTLTTDTHTVCFFSEISQMEGRTVTHRWMFGGEMKAEVSFEIGGPRWRVYSSKKLIPEWTGLWSVEVVDDGGANLYRASFIYKAPE
jgi:hypothetical protein